MSSFTNGYTLLLFFTITGKMQKRFQLFEVYYNQKDHKENLCVI